VKKIVSVIAVLLFTVAEACGGQPSNLLIGTWKLAGSGTAPSQYCQEPLIFAEKSRTEKDVNGTLNTAPVTYVAGDATKFPIHSNQRCRRYRTAPKQKDGEEIDALSKSAPQGLKRLLKRSVFEPKAAKKHVPEAKALIDAASVMPGLKSRPILQTGFSATGEAFLGLDEAKLMRI
jgi:hypothetical protein